MSPNKKIEQLLLSGQANNITLAVQLAHSQGVDLGTYLHLAKLLHIDVSNTEAALQRFFSKEILLLENKGLTQLPDWFFKHPTAKAFYLGQNNLTVLPPEANLDNIEDLGLEDNQLTQLPEWIASIPIQYLDLSNNQFQEVPPPLLKAQHLIYLNLNDNQIAQLSLDLTYWQHLETLSVANNSLTTLTADLSKLTKLGSLDLAGNQLNNYPDSLELLARHKLIKINLSYNQFNYLPPNLGTLAQQLQLTVLRGNPIPKAELEAAKASSWFQLNTVGWEEIDEKDFYETL